LKHKGLYASMWDRQREADEAEERLRQVRESDDMGVVVRGTPAAE
jgi:ATP-binding cassette subfamily B protein